MTSRPLVVVGSINQDSFAFVAEHPRPGETILATSSLVSLGGKGCNQAMAASLAGADVYFVGAVGADAAGDFALATLRDGGVDVSGVTRLADAATGVAYITVDEAGENTIVVASGANARVTADAASAGLTRVLETIGEVEPIVLVQGELPAEVNVAVATVARERGLSFVLNLAPVSHVDAPTISTSSPLVVNENEGADLLGTEGTPADVARGLHERYGIPVVITIGAEGAIIADENGLSRQPSPVPSEVVDTTGAGDAFVGVLAAALCAGAPLRNAARRAVVAASHAVESAGTVTSYATAAELEPLMARVPEPVAV